MKRYSAIVKAQAKVYIVDEDLTPQQAAKKFKGKPCASCIDNWARAFGWYKERDAKVDQYYMQMSPAAMSAELFERVKRMMADKSMDSGKFADALRKMQLSISDILDPKLQFPVMFQLLEDEVKFARQNYFDGWKKEWIEQFVECIRAFKNHVNARMNT